MNCDTCTENDKKTYNCPFYEGKKNTIRLRVGKNVYTECLVSHFVKEEYEGIDVSGMFSDAMDAYSINEAGHLPEEGAWGSQTDFFTKACVKVNRAVKKYEKQQLDKGREG